MCDVQRKFLVRVTSDNCCVRINGADGRPRTTSGFFATRFVLARDPAEAGSKALDTVRRELSQLRMDAAALPPDLAVDEAREDTQAYDDFAPGQGFTWF
jgi:hypothetical protein